MTFTRYNCKSYHHIFWCFPESVFTYDMKTSYMLNPLSKFDKYFILSLILNVLYSVLLQILPVLLCLITFSNFKKSFYLKSYYIMVSCGSKIFIKFHNMLWCKIACFKGHGIRQKCSCAFTSFKSLTINENFQLTRNMNLFLKELSKADTAIKLRLHTVTK